MVELYVPSGEVPRLQVHRALHVDDMEAEKAVPDRFQRRLL